MGQYLNKFKGVIGKVQTEQVLKLLNKQRNSGQIRSVEEFSNKLETLLHELTSTVLTPTLALFKAEPDIEINSETYNYMLDRVHDDLDAAFQEANKIAEVQEAHEAIVRDIILKNLKSGVAEIESKLTLYEFLAKDANGFDAALFSTFRESGEKRTLRSSKLSNVIFNDPRRNSIVPKGEDAYIELVGERLILPRKTYSQYTVASIRQIYDSESPQSEIVVELPELKLSNLIDNTKGTYWGQALLFSNIQEYVKTKFEFNFGATREINYIEIQPAVIKNTVLESIYYLDSSGTLIELDTPNLAINGPSVIPIKKTATKKVILTFKTTNYQRVEFKYRDGEDSLIGQALSEPTEGIRANKKKLQKDLDELISSQKIKDAVAISLDTAKDFFGYQYLVGFDNINFGYYTYMNRGIYVSSPLELPEVGMLGLKVEEKRPYIPYDGIPRYTSTTYDLDSKTELDGSTAIFNNEEEIHFLGSIEYWVIKQEFGKDGTLKKTDTLPILPLNVSRIYHERLILSEKSSVSKSYFDIGSTMFFTNTSATEGNIKVYRNGTLLTQNVDWTDVTSTLDRTPNNGNTPMKFKIRIGSFSLGDIYTVSYNPLVSSTMNIPQTIAEFTQISGLQVVDLVGDLTARHAEANKIVFGRENITEEINESKVFLVIILRRNTTDTYLTPAVEEYTLVAGYKNSKKFEGFE